ncbi:MAG TPA: tetratricopeptide repeat protein [Gammaproteobacteria bacterium]|nr:tetratricopeptide repeat protein [Gammaproteobacteria bacterium]
MYYTRIIIILSLLSLSACSQHIGQEYDENSAQSEGFTSDPESEIRLYQQAIMHLRDNDLDMAKDILVAFTKNRPELAGPWANLGLIKIKDNDLDAAEKLLKIAVEKNPKMAQAYNLLGFIENKRGNLQQAKRLYTQAIQHKHDYAVAHYNLALLYDIYYQETEKAIVHYQRYLELIEHSDQETIDWLNELKRSLERKVL